MITLVCYQVITRVHSTRSRSTAKDDGRLVGAKATEVVGTLGPIGTTPANESVARELAGLSPDPRGRVQQEPHLSDGAAATPALPGGISRPISG
jgi:hypothetical protein